MHIETLALLKPPTTRDNTKKVKLFVLAHIYTANNLSLIYDNNKNN